MKKYFDSYIEWCEITKQYQNERDEAIFLAGYNFSSIENKSPWIKILPDGSNLPEKMDAVPYGEELIFKSKSQGYFIGRYLHIKKPCFSSFETRFYDVTHYQIITEPED